MIDTADAWLQRGHERLGRDDRMELRASVTNQVELGRRDGEGLGEQRPLQLGGEARSQVATVR